MSKLLNAKEELTFQLALIRLICDFYRILCHSRTMRRSQVGRNSLKISGTNRRFDGLLTCVTEHFILHYDLVAVQGLRVHFIVGILVGEVEQYLANEIKTKVENREVHHNAMATFFGTEAHGKGMSVHITRGKIFALQVRREIRSANFFFIRLTAHTQQHDNGTEGQYTGNS